jgi:hypothetical protein
MILKTIPCQANDCSLINHPEQLTDASASNKPMYRRRDNGIKNVGKSGNNDN